MDSREIALNKSKYEILNSIKRIKELCKNIGFGELAYCIYYIHTGRVFKSQELESTENMSLDRHNDILQYTISCIYKYSDISIIPEHNYSINVNKIIQINKISNHIHNLHEVSSCITMLDKVTLVGERNQQVKLDFSQLTTDPVKKKSFEYTVRFQKSITKKKEELLSHLILLDKFSIKYAQYNIISSDIFGLTIEEIKLRLNELLNICIDNMKYNEKNMPILENGNIDAQSKDTLIEIVKSFIIDENLIFDIFGKNGMKFIRQFTFKRSDFKSHELNYHYISRKPLLKIKNKYIITPILLLDSLLNNFHYTILENKNYSDKHKQIMSDIFVNDIAKIGQKYCFDNFATELELMEGKNRLGDIDLILRHKEYDYDILIESKNHTVPLGIYFGNHETIEKRRKDLKESWEKKVDKRHRYLLQNYKNYNIKKEFKYLIVSRFPEILSHDSDYLVLSIDEFEFYLKNNCKYLEFYDLYEDYYNKEEIDSKDVKAFMKDILNCTIA
ncbi:MAG: hypothetical protein DRG78_01765 [Epsilonproteobacteria bacterium]|nr:MAG: hypothetical protein DRG78_01765 [Campylobacterota bacterium]